MTSTDSPDWHRDAYQALLDAIHIAGGQAPLAGMCPCTQGNVSQLVRRGSLLPSRFVLNVEAGTGVSRHRLRPDIYPLSLPAAAAPDVAASDSGVVRRPHAEMQKKGAA